MKTFVIPHGQQSLLGTLAQLDPKRRYVVTIDEPKRSNVRNAELHAAITDIAKQIQWGGEWMEAEEWKRLLTAGWMRATGRKVKLVPAIDGHGFDVLYQRTSRLTEAECRDLIQYIYAWGVDQGVVFKEPTPEGWRLPKQEAVT
jgi:hypothetical protein